MFGAPRGPAKYNGVRGSGQLPHLPASADLYDNDLYDL